MEILVTSSVLLALAAVAILIVGFGLDFKLRASFLFCALFIVTLFIGTVQGDSKHYAAILALSLMAFALAAVSSYRWLYRLVPHSEISWSRREDSWRYLSGWLIAFALLAALVATVTFYLDYGLITILPDADEIRVRTTADPFYRRHIVVSVLPFLYLYYLAANIGPGESTATRRDTIFLVGGFILVFAAQAFSGFRSRPILFLLSTGAVLELRRGKGLSPKLLASSAAVIAAVIIGVTAFRFNTAELIFIGERLYQRIVMANVENFQFIREFFGGPRRFRLGQTYWTDLQALAPGRDVGFAGRLTQIRSPGLTLHKVMTPSIAGEGYANWGQFGVLFTAAVGGTITGVVDRRGEESSINPLTCAFYGNVVVRSAWMVTQGISTVLVSLLAPIIAIYFVLRLAQFVTFQRPAEQGDRLRTPDHAKS